jgi:transcriptional regulator with XRE-family HTH domain
MKKKLDLTQLRDLRKRHRLNQSDFWSRFGVTQSGGSRYESGRAVPKPLALLIHFWHSGKIADDDLALAAKALGWPRRKAPAK